MGAAQNLKDYPLTLVDIMEHFDVSKRTARRYDKRWIPTHLKCRKMTFRGELRFKEGAIPCLEETIKARRGY